MRKKTSLVLILILLLVQTVLADFIGTVKKGNEAFQKKDYKAALEQYRAAEADNPTSAELDYNIGTALVNDGAYEEAIDKLQKALRTQDISVEASAHYNMGNTYYRMNNYQNAIKEFEEALKLNPQDMDAKFNLELTRKKLKEQMKPQQDPNNQNKSDSTQQQQQQQDQQNKQDQQNQDKQQQQQDQSQQDQQKQKDQQQQAQSGQPKQMTKEDAERILNALKDDEQDIQKKIRRNVQAGEYSGRDW